jgi:hypothetical protein
MYSCALLRKNRRTGVCDPDDQRDDAHGKEQQNQRDQCYDKVESWFDESLIHGSTPL